MANKKATNEISAPQIRELAVRLTLHAAAIRNPAAAKTIGEDMRLAARLLVALLRQVHNSDVFHLPPEA